MTTGSPEEVVEKLDRAFNAGDLEAVLSFYEDRAVVVTEPGQLAGGKQELRRFFEQVLAAKPSARQLKTSVLEADGIALFLSRWALSSIGSDHRPTERYFTAATVFRQQPDGSWKVLIDNAFSSLVLGPEP